MGYIDGRSGPISCWARRRPSSPLGVWSSYVDSRELQAFVPSSLYDRFAPADLWFDYVSDLGDGRNSTYALVRLSA